MVCIYGIKNKVNGKIYIGSTRNFHDRQLVHQRTLLAGKHINILLQRSYMVHGENSFDYVIIETLDPNISQVDLHSREDYYIDLYRSKHRDFGYNIANACGGDMYTNHPDCDKLKRDSAERLQAWRDALSDEEKLALADSRRGSGNSMYGKTHSDAVKQFLSDINSGRNHTNETIHKMKASFTPERRESISNFAKTRTSDRNPFYGKQHTSETKDKIRKGQEKYKDLHRGGKSFTIDDIKYPSLSVASKATGLHPTVIQWRINSKNPKFSGYIYVDEVPVEYTLGSGI